MTYTAINKLWRAYQEAAVAEETERAAYLAAATRYRALSKTRDPTEAERFDMEAAKYVALWNARKEAAAAYARANKMQDVGKAGA